MVLQASSRLTQRLQTLQNTTKDYLLEQTIARCEEWLRTPKNDLFAVSVMNLYKLGKNASWQTVDLPKQEDDELLTDITTHGDTLIVLSRSHLYYATAPYKKFTCVTLQAAEGNEGKVSLFRQIWLLHSGALFGTIGKLIVDGIGLVLIILCVTGIWYWIRHKATSMAVWHTKIGHYTSP